MSEEKYGCADCRRDVDVSHSLTEVSEALSATSAQVLLDRALDHMKKKTVSGQCPISCPNCWNYYEEVRRTSSACGG